MASAVTVPPLIEPVGVSLKPGSIVVAPIAVNRPVVLLICVGALTDRPAVPAIVPAITADPALAAATTAAGVGAVPAIEPAVGTEPVAYLSATFVAAGVAAPFVQPPPQPEKAIASRATALSVNGVFEMFMIYSFRHYYGGKSNCELKCYLLKYTILSVYPLPINGISI